MEWNMLAVEFSARYDIKSAKHDRANNFMLEICTKVPLLVSRLNNETSQSIMCDVPTMIRINSSKNSLLLNNKL